MLCPCGWWKKFSNTWKFRSCDCATILPACWCKNFKEWQQQKNYIYIYIYIHIYIYKYLTGRAGGAPPPTSKSLRSLPLIAPKHLVILFLLLLIKTCHDKTCGAVRSMTADARQGTESPCSSRSHLAGSRISKPATCHFFSMCLSRHYCRRLNLSFAELWTQSVCRPSVAKHVMD